MHIIPRIILGALLVFCLLAVPFGNSVIAQQQDEANQEEVDWKFELLREKNGYIRLNRETGAISFCTRVSGNIVCRLGADEREAFTSEITRLEDRLTELEDRIAMLETELRIRADTQDRPAESVPDDENGTDNTTEQDEEIDRAMNVVEQAMRRFFDMMRDFRENEKDSNSQ
jgi:hypothetical protein